MYNLYDDEMRTRHWEDDYPYDDGYYDEDYEEDYDEWD